MKINNQRLSIEQFKEQSWIAPMLSVLNSFMNDLANGFNSNKITIEDNLSQELKEINFINDATNFPLEFASKIRFSPKAVQVVYCYNKTDELTEAITSLPVWVYLNGAIKISSITGLTASKNYIIRVHVIY